MTNDDKQPCCSILAYIALLLGLVACTSAPASPTVLPTLTPSATAYVRPTLPPTWTPTYTFTPSFTATPTASATITDTPTPIVTPTPTYIPQRTTIKRDGVIIRNGPGHTYREVTTLDAGAEVAVLERNHIGNWIRIARAGIPRDRTFQRWVMVGMLELPDDMRFSRIPVNHVLPDVNMDDVDDNGLRRLYGVPIIPTISPTLHAIYRQGQQLGNDPQTITKVGDSLTADGLYLSLLSTSDYDLGPYDYLDAAYLYFHEAVPGSSFAAKKGLNTFSVFDAFLAGSSCYSGESPLQCEYRYRQPTISFIMFGPNDVIIFNVDDYNQQMRRIVDETLELGIIPVLSTFSFHPEHEQWSKALSYNLVLVQIAEEYDIPLINLWAAARDLPNYGLDADDIHMKRDGIRRIELSIGHESEYGVVLRNLLSLVMLHRIYSELEMGSSVLPASSGFGTLGK